MFAETKQKQNNRENINVKKKITQTIEIMQTGAWSLQNKQSDQKIPKRKTSTIYIYICKLYIYIYI